MRDTDSNDNGAWYPFDGGQTLGARGSESGIIIREEVYAANAVRITLERDCPAAPFTITCGIAGWLAHTRFFSNYGEAEQAFEDMKLGLADIYDTIPFEYSPQVEGKVQTTRDALQKFIERSP
jgi:hypothetical protein